MALPHVFPDSRREKEREKKSEQHHNVRSRLFFICCCFPQIQTLSDMCGFHWTVCFLGNGLEGSLPPASQARKRQTSEIRHSFHLAEPVEGLEGPRAYITKTNIRHFRGLHHKNGIKLGRFELRLCAGKVQRCHFKASLFVGRRDLHHISEWSGSSW